MFHFHRSRETGCQRCVGDTSKVQSCLASSMKAHHTWDPRKTISDTDHGGVFNFDFSKNGSLLGVACERKSVLLFDPFNGKMVASKTNAHTDSVNCVKFLDDRLFATCSDDTTVALWDTRYLKHNVQVFRGHANWVKNIEYDANQGILVTSGFDGCIYTWNINKYSTEECSNRVFYTSGLMRTKLSPDFTKLFISTHEGYIIAIHNLDLSTLGEDLKGFKPNMYRLMQRSGTPLRIGLMYNHLFVQERNRVEFIADWPTGNDANIISSIQVHPFGWCLLSRNTDSTENTEWTCVHDIQDEVSPKSPYVPHQYLERLMPHTSGAFCSSTYTPAFSSLAPSNRPSPHDQRSTSSVERQINTPRAALFGDGHDAEDEEEEEEEVDEVVEERERNAERQSEDLSVDDNIRDVNNDSDRTDVNTRTEGSVEPGTESTSEAPAGPDNTDNGAAPEEEEVGSGHVHNSLIQIRRGPRNEDGQFSFSISVHTVTGQTINFNQSDLDTDDEEEEVVASASSDSSEDEAGDRGQESRSSPRLPDLTLPLSEPSGQSDSDRQRSSDRFRAFYRSRINSFNVRRGGSTSSEHGRSPTLSEQRQFNLQVPDSVRTMRDETNSLSSRPINSTPRTNTFMFVLQSGTGEPTRRIMNLRYVDSYTPSENDSLQKKIHTNKKRLLGYAEECNVGRGFIKELAFSSDGRLFSSPFGFGLRLFAFDSHCNELCDCVPTSPVKLYEVTCSLAHVNYVVATKFSPTHNMVVSGCLDGKIAFHQPVL